MITEQCLPQRITKFLELPEVLKIFKILLAEANELGIFLMLWSCFFFEIFMADEVFT